MAWGSLTIADGAAVSNYSSFLSQPNPGWIGAIGSASDATGAVSGSGSMWSDIATLTVGGGNSTNPVGHGTLLVDTGAVVSSLSGIIGDTIGSTGSVTVQGNDSLWTMPGQLLVGGLGTATLTVADGGRVCGNPIIVGRKGKIKGHGGVLCGPVNMSGQLEPGESPGVLTVEGDYIQEPDGVLLADIGGSTPGTEYDQLVVTGNSSISGTLYVTLVNGFTPKPGQTFDIVQTGSLNPQFDHACGAFDFNVTYGPTTITLTATGNAIVDCNANAMADECDIAIGDSLDCNLNAIPDDCDGYVPPPYGDIFPLGGNGVVDVDDILRVLAGFIDPPSAPDADIEPCGGDGDIDVDDILWELGAFIGDPNPCPGPCFQ